MLRDPGLDLRLRLPGAAWTDEGGRPAPEPDTSNRRRAVTRRFLADGTEIALLHDLEAIPDRATAESAVAVGATALDNARRNREVQVRVQRLRDLRRGLLDAADQERHQLETELRSGPLREVDELDRLLSELSPERAEPLRRELALVRRELADIAHGLYPSTLLEEGLAGALADAAARTAADVTLDLRVDEAALPPRSRWPPISWPRRR